MAKPDATRGVAKGQRFVSVNYTKSSSPNLLRQQKGKADPFWVVPPQMAPQSPQKENKGSDPHFASASGEHKAQGGWKLVEESLCPCPERTLAWNRHFPLVVRMARSSSPSSFSSEC